MSDDTQGSPLPHDEASPTKRSGHWRQEVAAVDATVGDPPRQYDAEQQRWIAHVAHDPWAFWLSVLVLVVLLLLGLFVVDRLRCDPRFVDNLRRACS